MKENNDGVYYYCRKVMWKNDEGVFYIWTKVMNVNNDFVSYYWRKVMRENNEGFITMTVFITTVEKSCGKTMRGLLLLKRCNEGKQWCMFLTTEESHEGEQRGCLLWYYWRNVMKENNEGVYYNWGKVMKVNSECAYYYWRKVIRDNNEGVYHYWRKRMIGKQWLCLLLVKEKSRRKTMRVFVTTEERSWR